MSSTSPSTGANRTSPTRTCVKCHYNLTGLKQNRCPECGLAFDPLDDSALIRAKRIRRRIFSILLMAFVTYAPYAWLLFIDYPWSEYRWSWIRMWLALPLLLPASFISRQLGFDADDGMALVIVSISTLALVMGIAMIVARCWRMILLIAAIVLALSSLNSFGLYHLFQM